MCMHVCMFLTHVMKVSLKTLYVCVCIQWRLRKTLTLPFYVSISLAVLPKFPNNKISISLLLPNPSCSHVIKQMLHELSEANARHEQQNRINKYIKSYKTKRQFRLNVFFLNGLCVYCYISNAYVHVQKCHFVLCSFDRYMQQCVSLLF